MMSFGALKYFESVIKKLKKIIVLYQPRDLHLWYTSDAKREQSSTGRSPPPTHQSDKEAWIIFCGHIGGAMLWSAEN